MSAASSGVQCCIVCISASLSFESVPEFCDSAAIFRQVLLNQVPVASPYTGLTAKCQQQRAKSDGHRNLGNATEEAYARFTI